jgi:uncharacterized protein (DUF697 family)
MTPEQESQCKTIIKAHVIAAKTSNAVPVPGLGIAADLVALSTMTVALSKVFGAELTVDSAKDMVLATLKESALKQIKQPGKLFGKLVPGFGKAPDENEIEVTGWALAKEIEAKYETKAA